VKTRLLFLCTGNSCRSQMAEGWARTLRADEVEAHSAGIKAGGLDRRAVEVMREAGVDISGQRSKTLEEMGTLEFDLVVSVCDHAHESCPVFPGGARRVHRGFDDPPPLAAEGLEHYRRVRDEIRAFIEGELGDLLGSSRPGSTT